MWARLIFLALMVPSVAASQTAFVPQNARAPVPDIVVDTTDDELNEDGDCSLREAIAAANTNLPVDQCAAGSPGLDSVHVPTGAYTLSLLSANGFGGLEIADDLELSGAGAALTTVAGISGFDSSIFYTALNTATTFSLSGMTISGGKGGLVINDDATATITSCVIEGNISTAQYSKGGGIYAEGDVTLDRVTINNNRAADGGGIACIDCGLTIDDSTISNNRADVNTLGQGHSDQYTSEGGGLYVSTSPDGTDVTLRNVTISGNVANFRGGGIYVERENVDSFGPFVYLYNVTVTNNEADNNNDDTSDATYGGGVYIETGIVRAANSIFAANLEDDVLNDGPDCKSHAPYFESHGYNLVGNASVGSCDFDQIGDVANLYTIIDSGLGPLADNGGPTMTHALLFTSPAIDTGNSATPGSGGSSCIADDQRGMARPFHDACDIGAFEYHAENPTITLSETGDPAPEQGLPGGAGASLREAIIAANALPGSETINLPAGIYTLTNSGTSEDLCRTGDLDVRGGLTLLGDGQTSTIIDTAPGWDDRVFHLSTDELVTVADLTVQGGHPPFFGGAFMVRGGALLALDRATLAFNSANTGGGLYVSDGGSAELTDSTVRDNSASGIGGGIYLYQDATTRLERVTVRGNYSAGDGGGIAVDGTVGGLMTLTNATVSGNTCVGRGGGIHLNSTGGRMQVSNSTVVDNTCDVNDTTAGNGGGIFNLGSSVYLRNSIFALNEDGSSAIYAPDLAGAFVSRDYNLIGSLTSGATISGDVAGNMVGSESHPLDPDLGILKDNGGFTLTHDLLLGSPALEAGNPNGCVDDTGQPITDDQRSLQRPIGLFCDVGSVEKAGILFIDGFESGDERNWSTSVP